MELTVAALYRFLFLEGKESPVCLAYPHVTIGKFCQMTSFPCALAPKRAFELAV